MSSSSTRPRRTALSDVSNFQSNASTGRPKRRPERTGDSQSTSTRNTRNSSLDTENQEFFPGEQGSNEEEEVVQQTTESTVPASSSTIRCTDINRLGRTTSTKRRRTTDDNGADAPAEESQRDHDNSNTLETQQATFTTVEQDVMFSARARRKRRRAQEANAQTEEENMSARASSESENSGETATIAATGDETANNEAQDAHFEDPTPGSDDESCSVNGDEDSTDRPSRPVVDIDSLHQDNAAFVTAYAMEYFTYLRSCEVPRELRADYMETVQNDINPGMRAVLVDWLVEVTEEYRLVPETLYHAVQLVDRCLSIFSIHRTRLQLLGCSALLVAAKIEELFRNAPSVSDYVYISDNTYRRREVLQMEAQILQKMEFRLRAVTPRTYMSRFLRAAGATKGDLLTNLVKYLTELTLPEYRFLKYRPSEVAAAAILCARKILNIDSPWTQDLEFYTGYKQNDIKVCAEDIAQAHRDAPTNTLQAIKEKYGHAPYEKVSQNPRVQPLAPGAITRLNTAPSSASVAAGVKSNQFA